MKNIITSIYPCHALKNVIAYENKAEAEEKLLPLIRERSKENSVWGEKIATDLYFTTPMKEYLKPNAYWI